MMTDANLILQIELLQHLSIRISYFSDFETFLLIYRVCETV